MSDTTSNDKTIRVPTRKPLSLKRDTDTVRQSFSGGRSKAVVVEKKRSRVPIAGKRPDLAVPAAEQPPKPVEAARPQVPAARAEPGVQPQPRPRATGMVLRTLTDEERDARTHALQESRIREAEERRHAELEARNRSDEEARLARERTDAERRKAEEESRR